MMPPATVAASRSRTGFPFEAALRMLMRTSEEGVLVLDPRGRVRSLNPAAERMLGVRARQALGQPASTLVRTAVPADDPARDARESVRIERETVVLRPDGSGTPALIRSRRIGRPAWVLLTLLDLGQQRRTQEELRRNERLATLGQLSAGVAHEIRNPLAGIGTSAQVLLRRFEPRDERARFARVILDEVARLDRLVTHLLQYARPRTPELAPQQLAECLEQVRERTAETANDAGIQVELDAPRALSAVHVDRDLVLQVLYNVTLNAIQAMPKGGTLRYELRRTRRRRPNRGPGRRASDAPSRGAADPGWIDYQQIRVIDTGSGIPRAIQSKLFDPFFTTRARGTGLGLAISHTIMQEHGGAIEIASREGRGTTVLIGFPVEKRHGERRDTDRDAGRAHAARR
jgi:PAS domain S-box-containing protein